MRLRLLIALAAIGLLAACGGDDDGASTSSTPIETSDGETATPASEACTDTAAPILGDVTWDNMLPAELPDLGEYTVEDADGDGDAPLVNIVRGDEVIGTLELLQFPTDGNIDTTLPVTESLAGWARRFYDDVTPSREEAGETFAGDEPAESRFGTACGIQYGYAVTDENEAVIERYAGYVVHDSAMMYLIVGLYDAANTEQGFTSAEALQDFKTAFAHLVAALDFPPANSEA